MHKECNDRIKNLLEPEIIMSIFQDIETFMQQGLKPYTENNRNRWQFPT